MAEGGAGTFALVSTRADCHFANASLTGETVFRDEFLGGPEMAEIRTSPEELGLPQAGPYRMTNLLTDQSEILEEKDFPLHRTIAPNVAEVLLITALQQERSIG